MIQLAYLFLLISFIILLVFMFVKEFMIIGKKDDGGAQETIDEMLQKAFSEDWYSGVPHADLPKYVRIVKNKARYNQWGNGDKVWEVFKWETCGRPGLYLADIGAPFLITAEDLEPVTEKEFNSKA